MAKREVAERIDGQLALEARAPSHQIADWRGELEAASDRRWLRSSVASIGGFHPMQAPRPARALTAVPSAGERRRLERDLHGGVQNELVAPIVKLALAQQIPETPSALVEMLAGLEARAQAGLDSVRDIARGIYPSAARRLRPRGSVACAGGARSGRRESGRKRASWHRSGRGGRLLRLLRGDSERRKIRRPRSRGHAPRLRHDQGSLRVYIDTTAVGSIQLAPRRAQAYGTSAIASRTSAGRSRSPPAPDTAPC